MKTFEHRRPNRSRWSSVARRSACLAALVLPQLTATAASGSVAPSQGAALPPVTHIWLIVLENEDYASTFGNPSADPYLAQSLPAEGALLEDYYGTGHESADNYISLASGQPPNPANQADCQTYSGFTGGSVKHGIESGSGCIYPASIKSIGTQLSSKGLSWKAYEEDMGNDPAREAAACGHPAPGATDGTQQAEAGDGYATRHDPFVYFSAVTTHPSYCDAHVVALGSPSGTMPPTAVAGETGLATDLASSATTPSYSLITPNLCNDGHDFPCKNQPSGASALADIDSFLQTWVPKITSSPAYQAGGLLEITFDESDGAQSDSTACCNESAGPASPLPGIAGPGGGSVGAVLLSPFIAAGTTSTTAYNHYAMLGTDERLLGLSRLGEARSVTSLFGSDVFTNAGAAKPQI